MTPVIEIENLSCGYGTCAVVRAVSLAVRPGEIVALIGPNGAGKTTLLHTLARVLPPLAGTIRLGGVPVERLGPRAAARVVALAPQRATATAWPLTVGESVALGRAPHRGWLLPYTARDRGVIARAMQRMGVDRLESRTVSTLSGGEVRRVLLARALAQEPRLLLLDEPATYLDINYQAELLGLVRELARRDGLAVVLTVHDLSLASLCADRVVLLAPGRVVAAGPVAEVLSERVLRPVYGANLEVFPHPAHGAPLVLPTPPDTAPSVLTAGLG